MRFLMPPQPLTDSETQKYYQNERRLMIFIVEILYPK